MKLPKSIPVKETLKLFLGKYNFKIVIICPAAGWFRSRNYSYTLSNLDELTPKDYAEPWSRINNDADLQFCYKLAHKLTSFDNSLYDLRVESPCVNFYTNETKYIEGLSAIDELRIKFLSIPNSSIQSVPPGKVLVKKLDYDFKIYLGTIKKKNHSNFIDWAKTSNKIRLTKRCIADLSKDSSWGGSYFYVKDDKTLTMVKIFLGANITRIEQVIKG